MGVIPVAKYGYGVSLAALSFSPVEKIKVTGDFFLGESRKRITRDTLCRISSAP